MNAKEILKTYFGYDTFRAGQESMIRAILEGRDALAVMPTGAGKSICYQVPALMMPGVTLVVSPLISLMQDQVKALHEAGIDAGFVNSSLSEGEIRAVLEAAASGHYKLLYVAPERLESREFISFAGRIEISMVTVDEAHCISQWGQDFRPSYLKIVTFIRNLKKRPIVSAFTATATEEVKNDIICTLNLENPHIVTTGFDRENLYYRVETGKRKDDFIAAYIEEHPKDSGIIYCATRKNVDAVYEMLSQRGVPAARYHAGIENEIRKQNQEDFIYDRAPVMVATNAFGMGIDKSNVRYVIHYNMPQSMENYYQEAGRAGRDGEPAQCILLFSPQDIMIDQFLLDHKDFTDISCEEEALIRQRDSKRLQTMENYCKTTGCLRSYILRYFEGEGGAPCGNCGNCQKSYTEVDMTAEAKWVINCLAETRGRYGLQVVCGTLLGANRARLKELGTVNYKSYGRLRESREAVLKLLIDQMIAEGYIHQSEDRYRLLRMGNIEPLKDENTRVILRLHQEKEPERAEKPGKTSRKRRTEALTGAGYDLFEQLRALRMTIAREAAVPPYIVFSDRTLIDLCVKCPQNREQMLQVSGVGTAKFEKYGERFLDAIISYRETHPEAVTAIRDEEEETHR